MAFSRDSTLVLDVTGQPYRVCSWEIATVNWYRGAWVVLARYNERLVHPGQQVYAPAVVQALRQPRRARVRLTRQNVFLRDHGRCQYCDAPLTRHTGTFDHVIPRSHGGKVTWSNIVLCCKSCNAEKGARTPQQAGMLLRHAAPRPPTFKALLQATQCPTEWQPFIQ
jgi:hypothetical protein